MQANKPVIGIVQDTLLGARLMTKRDTFIEKEVLMNMLMWLEDWDGIIPMPAILKPRPLWTGKQVRIICVASPGSLHCSLPSWQTVCAAIFGCAMTPSVTAGGVHVPAQAHQCEAQGGLVRRQGRA